MWMMYFSFSPSVVFQALLVTVNFCFLYIVALVIHSISVLASLLSAFYHFTSFVHQCDYFAH